MQPIADFSELGRFLDVPVRYYSAGMLVRLAFSISTSIEPDILIVDEVLSAGDMEFQAKARARMKALIASARAVVIVSHDMSSLAQLCDRVLWLDHGTIRLAGPTAQVIAGYTEQATQAARRKRRNVPVHLSRIVDASCYSASTRACRSSAIRHISGVKALMSMQLPLFSAGRAIFFAASDEVRGKTRAFSTTSEMVVRGMVLRRAWVSSLFPESSRDANLPSRIDAPCAFVYA